MDKKIRQVETCRIFWCSRRKYLREHQKALYTAMMLGDTLNAHLGEVDHTATEMYDRSTSQLAAQEGITEQLKATNQMEWLQQMNNIRNRATEVVWKELSVYEAAWHIRCCVSIIKYGMVRITRISAVIIGTKE